MTLKPEDYQYAAMVFLSEGNERLAVAALLVAVELWMQ